ncbi:hypothetical protein DXB60_03340 [Bacteroides fragilis]|uniref:Uncharacterized protein n=1 Tax=Bacteroides fragilis TaxID=817 RepID=A0A0I9S7Y5_BACFG|nr:hypothetical protein DXB60_03340 [Bacteroides fragilis]
MIAFFIILLVYPPQRYTTGPNKQIRTISNIYLTEETDPAIHTANTSFNYGNKSSYTTTW